MIIEIRSDFKCNDLRLVSCIGFAGGSCLPTLFLFHLASLSNHPYLLILLPPIHHRDLLMCMNDIWCISAWLVYFIGTNTRLFGFEIQYMRIIALMLMNIITYQMIALLLINSHTVRPCSVPGQSSLYSITSIITSNPIKQTHSF